MRGDLLRANSLEQSLHVVVVREGDGVLGCVVWMLVSLFHVHQLVLVERLAISSLILRLFPVARTQNNWLEAMAQ